MKKGWGVSNFAALACIPIIIECISPGSESHRAGCVEDELLLEAYDVNFKISRLNEGAAMTIFITIINHN